MLPLRSQDSLPVVGQTFPDGISTRITLHPSLGARSFIVDTISCLKAIIRYRVKMLDLQDK